MKLSWSSFKSERNLLLYVVDPFICLLLLCLWTTLGKICKILTKKTDLRNFDKGSCKSKAELPMQIDSAKRI